MPSLLSKLAGTAERKGFTQSPFWATSGPIWDSIASDKERIASDFSSYVHHAYKSNGLVFACMLTRLLVLSEARFAFRRIENGRPSQLFGSPALALLERPWPGATTGELIARIDQDSSLAGNAFITVVGQGDERRLRRLRPDWVTIIAASEDDDPNAIDAHVVAYWYRPGGSAAREEVLLPSEVAHVSPIPDPIAQWRGMSWLTPILREIDSDTAATKHKAAFFRNGATTNFVVTYDKAISPESFQRFVALFKERQEGVERAYQTMHLAGGADVKVVGSNLQQLDLKVTQGVGESRVAAASGIHPVIVGLSEGLQGSSLNAGNFASARRLTADRTLRPLWRIMAASLETLVQPPAGAQLWYDARDVAFLREDAKDDAGILQMESAAIASLLAAGFKADVVVDAVVSGDLRRLAGAHSGLFSVQLQPPGSGAPASLGNGKARPSGDMLRLATEVRHSEEVARLQAEITRAKARRRVVVERDEDGLISGVAEVAGR